MQGRLAREKNQGKVSKRREVRMAGEELETGDVKRNRLLDVLRLGGGDVCKLA